MRAFVTGAAGQLGSDLVRELQKRGEEVIASGSVLRKDMESYVVLDITDEQKVSEVLESIRPDVVFHCAAWTAVDAAEEPDNYEKVWAVNVKGTENIARICKKIHAKMIYISTDYVFDGYGTDPWRTDCDFFAPQNVYGKTKLLGEQTVRANLEQYFIVRIAWVFGKNGKNFVNTMLSLGKKQKVLRVVSDQVGTPTYTTDLARFLADLADTERYGIYHATNEGGYISWYDFAGAIFRKARLLGYTEYQDVKVLPVKAAEYGKTKAARPLNSRMDKSRITEEGFRPLPKWQDALERYLREILPEEDGQE